jgi:hypothetical protein
MRDFRNLWVHLINAKEPGVRNDCIEEFWFISVHLPESKWALEKGD